MLYEYNGKIYVRPFSNKIVEVTIEKKGNEYNVKATEKSMELNQEIQKKMVEITLEEAYKKANKSEKMGL